MAVKFSQFVVKTTNTDVDYIVGYKGTENVQITPTDFLSSAGGLSSVGLTMPEAFSVANSPLTANGTLEVTAIGTSSQFIRGDGTLATIPSTGGGNNVSFYLNGGTAASVAGYYQMSNIAVVGTNADFTRVGNGLISQWLTDVGSPNVLSIQAGNWNFEIYMSVSSSGGTPEFYVELLKYNGSTFTTIANSSASPEPITSGTAIDLYLTSLAIPTTTLLSTDRLAVRVYIVNNSGGRTITMHTQDSHLCQVITNFAGPNIYNSDGTLTGNRVVTMGSNTLSFTRDLLVNGLIVGKGVGNISTNTALGISALNVSSVGFNTAVGYNALLNTTTQSNTAIGYNSLKAVTTGGYNTGVGESPLLNLTTGENNSAVGQTSLAFITTGSLNSALGARAGRYYSGNVSMTASDNSVYLGAYAKALANGQTNQIVIGYDATGAGSNSVVLGNDSITKTILKGNIGINTLNPTEKLEIQNGNIRVYGNSVVGAPVLNMTKAEYSVGCYINSESGSSDFMLFAEEFYIGDNVFQVQYDGNVNNLNGAYGTISDITLKENIIPASSKLEELLKVNIVNYNLINDNRKQKQIGVIAQELEEIFPAMISTNNDGIKSVKTSIFIPMLIKAVQEQQEQIEELKKLIK